MRAMALGALWLGLACSGCALTRKVWTGATEQPYGKPTVRISREGDVCVDYQAEIRTAPWGVGFLGSDVPGEQWPAVSLRRAVVVRAAALERLLSAEEGRKVIVIPGSTLRRYVRPSRPGSGRAFWVGDLPGDPGAWRAFPLDSTGHATFTYRRAAGAPGAEEPRAPTEVSVTFELPTRSGLRPLSYPLRALLTPLASAADLVADAVIVATYPVWGPVACCLGGPQRGGTPFGPPGSR